MFIDNEGSGVNLEAMLERLATCYPNINFRKYEEALRSNGVTYLDVAVKFSFDWYTNPDKIGMDAGEASLLLEWVSREIVKEEEAKRKSREMRKTKGRKKACLSSPQDSAASENVPPIPSSSSRLD